MACHYEVEDCVAGQSRAGVAVVRSFFAIEGRDAGFGGQGVRAARPGTAGEGGAPGGRAQSGRRWKSMVSGDVSDESISGAEESSKSAGVVLMRRVGLHDLLGAVVDALLDF